MFDSELLLIGVVQKQKVDRLMSDSSNETTHCSRGSSRTYQVCAKEQLKLWTRKANVKIIHESVKRSIVANRFSTT